MKKQSLLKNNKHEWIAKLVTSRKPEMLLLIAFVVVILLGSVLLSLPFCNLAAPASYLNNLFVAVSAVCVTGLSTVTVVTQYNLLGKIIMILLMQVGGLGPMTIIAIVMQRNSQRMATVEKKLFAAASGKSGLYDVPGYIRRIFLYTLFFELAGFIFLAFRFTTYYPLKTALFNGLFLSVSAFTNAGFDPVASDSLVGFAADPVISFTVMALIVTGGLGFMVWFELQEYFRTNMRSENVLNRTYRYLSVHAKVVLRATAFLLLTGTVLFYMFEARNPGTIRIYDVPTKVLVSMFQSVTLRTAGFATVQIGRCTRPMLLIMCIYMLIGGSPGGTAGGIKTTTAVVLYRTALNSLNDSRPDGVISKRRIAPSLLKHAFVILTLYVTYIFLAMIVLTISEPRTDFFALLFEVFSAIATVGISTGITSGLSAVGRITIMILMFIGRLGPLSLFLAFHKEQKITNHIVYPDANIIIG